MTTIDKIICAGIGIGCALMWLALVIGYIGHKMSSGGLDIGNYRFIQTKEGIRVSHIPTLEKLNKFDKAPKQ